MKISARETLDQVHRADIARKLDPVRRTALGLPGVDGGSLGYHSRCIGGADRPGSHRGDQPCLAGVAAAYDSVVCG